MTVPEETSLKCPLGRDVPAFPRCLQRCQYSVRENCEYKACQSIMQENSSERRVQLTAELYGVSIDRVRNDSRNVMIAVLLSAFFEFQNGGKPLLDCKKAELERLRASEAEFYKWRKGATNPSFQDCMRVLEIIETNL